MGGNRDLRNNSSEFSRRPSGKRGTIVSRKAGLDREHIKRIAILIGLVLLIVFISASLWLCTRGNPEETTQSDDQQITQTQGDSNTAGDTTTDGADATTSPQENTSQPSPFDGFANQRYLIRAVDGANPAIKFVMYDADGKLRAHNFSETELPAHITVALTLPETGTREPVSADSRTDDFEMAEINPQASYYLLAKEYRDDLISDFNAGFSAESTSTLQKLVDADSYKIFLEALKAANFPVDKIEGLIVDSKYLSAVGSSASTSSGATS